MFLMFGNMILLKADHPDIFFRGSKVMNAPDLCKECINILKGPGNKCKKSFCPFWLYSLYFPDLY